MDLADGRIHGTEMEWAGMTPGERGDSELRQIKDNDLQKPILKYLDQSNTKMTGKASACFLQNGARFYADIGDRREYATPEDTSPLGTLANELASEVIMNDIADIYQDTYGERVMYTKRVIDDKGITGGYHVSYCTKPMFESYEIENELDPSKFALFAVFAATRSTIFGAGCITPGGKFSTAQKVISLNHTYHSGTTYGYKPLVNLRHQPLADGTSFQRFHDTSSDPTMSPWATRVRIGAASIVLRMIENGETIPGLRLNLEPYLAARTIAYDPESTLRFSTKSYESLSALEIQARIASTARDLHQQNIIQLSHEEQWSLDEWEKAISDLHQSPKLTVDRIEWVMKREVLNRMQKKHGWSWNSARMSHKDKQFSDISTRGIARALRETVWSKYMPSETFVTHRIKHAPEQTRAAVRGQYISFFGNNWLHQTVDWHEIYHGNTRIGLPNPYESHSQKLETLIKANIDKT